MIGPRSLDIIAEHGPYKVCRCGWIGDARSYPSHMDCCPAETDERYNRFHGIGDRLRVELKGTSDDKVYSVSKLDILFDDEGRCRICGYDGGSTEAEEMHFAYHMVCRHLTAKTMRRLVVPSFDHYSTVSEA